MTKTIVSITLITCIFLGTYTCTIICLCIKIQSS